MRRRALLKGMVAATASSLIAAKQTVAQSSGSAQTIKAAAAARGILFGSAFDQHVFHDEDYAHLLCEECQILTTNYSFKFGSLRRSPTEIDFRAADGLLDWAEHCKLLVRGHNLIWNEWLPDWLGRLSSREMASLLDRHIDEVVGHYAGRIHSWDVVNEPIWVDHGDKEGLRKGPWYNAVGPDYIARSFRRARKADPHAKLVLNDAYLEYRWKVSPYAWKGAPSARWDQVRSLFLGLVRHLLDTGAPIDAVGIESHLNPRLHDQYDRDSLLEFLRSIQSLGLDIYITELDVTDPMSPKDEISRDRIIADQYYQYLRDVLSVSAVKVIITWELADRETEEASEANAGRRPKSDLPRPLPFDFNLKRKPAYDAIVAALTNNKFEGIKN
jgi:endo-1,4-beta-xylanase